MYMVRTFLALSYGTILANVSSMVPGDATIPVEFTNFGVGSIIVWVLWKIYLQEKEERKTRDEAFSKLLDRHLAIYEKQVAAISSLTEEVHGIKDAIGSHDVQCRQRNDDTLRLLRLSDTDRTGEKP